jgi:hypothetical protein
VCTQQDHYTIAKWPKQKQEPHQEFFVNGDDGLTPSKKAMNDNEGDQDKKVSAHRRRQQPVDDNHKQHHRHYR